MDSRSTSVVVFPKVLPQVVFSDSTAITPAIVGTEFFKESLLGIFKLGSKLL